MPEVRRTRDLWPCARTAGRGSLEVAPADEEIGSGTQCGNGDLRIARPTIVKMGAAASSPTNTGRRVSFLRRRVGAPAAWLPSTHDAFVAEVKTVAHTKRWTVDIVIDEHDDKRLTRAEARLHTTDRSDLRGEGTARRNPADVEVPEIGDELAVARALSELAHRLLDATVGDIEEVTHRPVRMPI